MNNKLTLLKEYVDRQAQDYFLWFRPVLSTEKYLQEELRRISWLIEDASNEQIQNEIKKFDARI